MTIADDLVLKHAKACAVVTVADAEALKAAIEESAALERARVMAAALRFMHSSAHIRLQKALEQA